MRSVRARIHRMTLLHRFLAMEVGVFLLVFAGVLLFVAHYADQLRGRIDHERLLVTRAFGAQVDDWLRDAYGNLELIAAAPDLASPDAIPELPRHAGTFQRGLVVVDDHARPVAFPFGTPPVGFVGLAPHLEGAAAGIDRIAFGFRPLPTRTPVLALAVPLPAATAGRLGLTGGFLVGFIDPEASPLNDIVRRAHAVGETGHAEIVDADGIALVTTELEHLLRDGDHPDFYRRVLASGVADIVEQVAYVEPEHTDDHVMGFVRLQTLPWGLAIGGDASETYAPIHTLWVAFYGLAGVLGVFAFTITVVGIERLVRPVRSLSDAARRVAGGEVETPIRTTDGGEIGELGESVERMRDSLYRWGRELDHRVGERTAELSRRNRELAASAAVAQAVASTLDTGDLIELATRRIEESLGVEGVAIFLRARAGHPAERRLSAGAQRLLSGMPDSACERCLETAADHQRTGGGTIVGGPSDSGPTCATESMIDAGCSVLRVPIASAEGIAGVLCVVEREAPVADSDRRILELLASEVALGLRNATLYEDLSQREAARHRLLAKVLSAQEDERRRLARELHDGIAQALTGVTLQIDGLLALPGERWEDGRVRLDQLRSLSAETLDELRMMILALRPPALDDLGLIAAIERYATRVTSSSAVEVTMQNELDGVRLSPNAEVTVFRILQEALNNVVRHSGASRATVALRLHEGQLRASVEDNGHGFVPSGVRHEPSGVGIEGMTERAELLGGTLRVESAPGHGTVVCLEVEEALVRDEVARGVRP